MPNLNMHGKFRFYKNYIGCPAIKTLYEKMRKFSATFRKLLRIFSNINEAKTKRNFTRKFAKCDRKFSYFFAKRFFHWKP